VLESSEVGLTSALCSGFSLIQSGMMTALISSCMVMSRAFASFRSSRKFASPKEKMNFAMSLLMPSGKDNPSLLNKTGSTRFSSFSYVERIDSSLIRKWLVGKTMLNIETVRCSRDFPENSIGLLISRPAFYGFLEAREPRFDYRRTRLKPSFAFAWSLGLEIVGG